MNSYKADRGEVNMYISVHEAANRLSVSKKTIYRRIADGSIPAVKMSPNCIRIKESDLEQFLCFGKEEKSQS